MAGFTYGHHVCFRGPQEERGWPGPAAMTIDWHSSARIHALVVLLASSHRLRDLKTLTTALSLRGCRRLLL